MYTQCVAKKRSQHLSPQAIRDIRQALGLSVEQAAEKVGVTPRTWLSWELESQDRRPSKSHTILIGLLKNGEL